MPLNLKAYQHAMKAIENIPANDPDPMLDEIQKSYRDKQISLEQYCVLLWHLAKQVTKVYKDILEVQRLRS